MTEKKNQLKDDFNDCITALNARCTVNWSERNPNCDSYPQHIGTHGVSDSDLLSSTIYAMIYICICTLEQQLNNKRREKKKTQKKLMFEHGK